MSGTIYEGEGEVTCKLKSRLVKLDCDKINTLRQLPEKFQFFPFVGLLVGIALGDPVQFSEGPGRAERDHPQPGRVLWRAAGPVRLLSRACARRARAPFDRPVCARVSLGPVAMLAGEMQWAPPCLLWVRVTWTPATAGP